MITYLKNSLIIILRFSFSSTLLRGGRGYKIRIQILQIFLFLTGEACSTCTAVRGVWCECHYKKCNRDIVDEVVIEVDELDKSNISAEAGKQDE